MNPTTKGASKGASKGATKNATKGSFKQYDNTYYNNWYANDWGSSDWSSKEWAPKQVPVPVNHTQTNQIQTNKKQSVKPIIFEEVLKLNIDEYDQSSEAKIFMPIVDPHTDITNNYIDKTWDFNKNTSKSVNELNHILNSTIITNITGGQPEAVTTQNNTLQMMTQSDINDILSTVNMRSSRNYTPVELAKFTRSMIHRSHKTQLGSYEMLEFLGDSIYAGIITHYITERYPFSNECALSILRTRLICGKVTTYLAFKLRLWRFLITSKFQEAQGVRSNRRIMEDIFEAFVGALFLVEGYNLTSTFIKKLLDNYIDFASLCADNDNYRNIVLQKHDDKEFNCTKTELADGTGVFTVMLVDKVSGQVLSTSKSMKTKKAAESDAARAFFQRSM